METTMNLRNDTVEKVQDLIQINLDSAKGCREAAEKVEDAAITRLFSDLANERSAQAEELKKYVRLNREKPEDSGTAAGAMHRMWLSFRSAINGGEPKVILIEAEKGEDKIKAEYEQTLKETAGSPLNSVLLRQYAAVKAGHDRVRDLRDAHLQN
jgi:uncharacterized protein (TIGR02284 family)